MQESTRHLKQRTRESRPTDCVALSASVALAKNQLRRALRKLRRASSMAEWSDVEEARCHVRNALEALDNGR